MNEKDLIQRYFAPLSTPAETAFGLTDDAACLPTLSGKQRWVVTTDTLIAEVHFMGNEAPNLIARKALRVNLSDLAAMGATPHHYTLNLALPATTDEAWIADFATGLAHDQRLYGISILGGDTTRTHGPLCISITAFGTAPNPTSILRKSGASPGDILAVTGSIGDAWLGLQLAQNAITLPSADAEFCLQRYWLPQPRHSIATALHGLAHAATDSSDGLVEDATQLCHASGCGMHIRSADIPLSPAAQQALHTHAASLSSLITGGDDYELILAIPPQQWEQAQQKAQEHQTLLTAIGYTQKEDTCHVIDAHGHPMSLPQSGHQHRW